MVVAAVNYANAIRRHGHLVANLSPIGSPPPEVPHELDPRTYQITDRDLLSCRPTQSPSGAIGIFLTP